MSEFMAESAQNGNARNGGEDQQDNGNNNDQNSTVTAQQQLNDLHCQLQQVEEFITSDPSNEQYLQTKDDLLTLITMTENLIDVQALQDISHNSSYSTGDEGIQNLLNKFAVGDHIEVMSGERPFPAILLSINSSTFQCTLKYYEFGSEVQIPLRDIRKIPRHGEFHAEQIAPGLRCQCKYPADQKWYDAKIESVTADGYMVVFTQYGNTLEVPLEYLRHMRLSTSKLQKRLSERHMEPSATIAIPENLKINPTDTEAQKEKKKRKIKAIKSKARIEVKEQEQSATQDNWKAFQSKAEKKGKLTTAPTTKKQSLFTSPDAVDGRVGVTGSGQGMTEYEHRKKYKFNIN